MLKSEGGTLPEQSRVVEGVYQLELEVVIDRHQAQIQTVDWRCLSTAKILN